jgi:hypothetical protein
MQGLTLFLVMYFMARIYCRAIRKSMGVLRLFCGCGWFFGGAGAVEENCVEMHSMKSNGENVARTYVYKLVYESLPNCEYMTHLESVVVAC